MRTKDSKGSSSSGGRRPRRQRTQVQHYTDDIPGTFTKKKKRRRDSNGESMSSESESDDEELQQQQQQQQPMEVMASAPVPANNHKKKRGRPPQKSSVAAAAAVTKQPRSSPTNTNTNISYSHSHSSNKKKDTPLSPPRKLQEMRPPSPPKTTLMPHTASIAPILPLATTCPLARHSLAQQYPVVYGRGLGEPSPPESPQWNSVSSYDFYFPEDYKPTAMPTNHEVEDTCIIDDQPTKEPAMAPVLQQGPWPVCRFVTSVCAYDTYLAVGDSAGFITIYTTGAAAGRKTMGALTRLDTSASKREHPRQRQIQAKAEHNCRHKPELLEKRSAFWATERTPNTIESITWSGNLIVFLTPYEMEAIQLTATLPTNTTTSSSNGHTPSQSFGGCQNCQRLWTIPISRTTAIDGPRSTTKINGNKALLTGGELVGSCLELHKKGNMMLWNTWGVTTTTMTMMTMVDQNKDKKTSANDHEEADETNTNNESKNEETTDDMVCGGEDWPLLLMRDPQMQTDVDVTSSSSSGFIKVIPFQRQEDEEKPAPMPVKRSPGRPPKKKPKPKIPIKQNELVWKAGTTKCHAAMWLNSHSSRGDRIVVIYGGGNNSVNSGADTTTASTAAAAGNSATETPQLHLALLKLTNDSNEEDAEKLASGTAPVVRPQYARLLRQTAVPISASARNVANVPEVTLNQSTKGTYTLVAGPRGVRMYHTETMVCMRVYGEGVSLHGKAMVWKSCFVLDNRLQQQLYQQQQDQLEPSSPRKVDGSSEHDDEYDASDKGSTLLRQNRQGFVWIEQDNPLASMLDTKDNSSSDSNKIITRRRSSMHRIRASSSIDEDEEEEDDDEHYWLHQAWIVGIPHHFRGPKELKETLYFWQGTEKLPLFTLPLPHQCGGVESMHPLVSSHNRQRNEGMWMRLMVSTVNGECFELAPTMTSDFPGNMYNPGYSVLEDNVEYIENEDELDKVMVEVAEETEESIPESPVVAAAASIGGDGLGDIDDPELAEAIRLSLLEAQGKSVSQNEDSDSSDEDEDPIVVKDDFGDDNYMYGFSIPCEPEPFLRQKLLPDFDSETMMAVDATVGAKSAKDAEFASEVLSILPQSKRAQDRWEQQKSRQVETSSVGLQMPKPAPLPENGGAGSAPAASRTGGKGKRARAGNLEALLKSSVRPELREFMTTRSRAWADGSGGTLQDDAWDDAVTASNDCSQQTPGTEQGQAASERNLVGAASLPTKNESNQDTNKDKDTVMSEASNVDKVEKPIDGGEGDVAMASAPTEATKAATETENQPLPSIPIEIPTTLATVQNTADTVDVNGMQVAIIELRDYNDASQQYWCTGTVDIPLALEDCDLSPGQENAVSEGERPDVNGKGSESGGKTVDGSKNGSKEPRQHRSPIKRKTEPLRCAACHGRMVRHSCGKRALPIDFEAIAREEERRKEEERKERERLRQEKRRQAEAKRKEEKRKKKEEEKRKKMEMEEESRRIQANKIAEARANQANIGECLGGTPSPRIGPAAPGRSIPEHNGIKLPNVAIEAAKLVDPVHTAITDAWKEHAEKFTDKSKAVKNTDEASEKSEEKKSQDPIVRSNPISALDAMAAAATLHGSVSHNRVSASVATTANYQPPVEKPPTVVNASVVSTSYNSTPESAPGVVAQHPVPHGFISPSDAYPQHAQSTTLETRGTFSAASAAQIARRKQILNSYHGVEGGSNAPMMARVVDLSGNSHAGLHRDHEARGHSFQISPMSNPSQTQTPYDHTNHAQASQTGVSMPHLDKKRPYFGYTLLSNNSFKPRLSSGSYATSEVVTAASQPQPQNPPPAPAAVPARESAVAPNGVPTLHPHNGYFLAPHQSGPPHIARPVGWQHSLQGISQPPASFERRTYPFGPPHPMHMAPPNHSSVGHPVVGAPYHHYHHHGLHPHAPPVAAAPATGNVAGGSNAPAPVAMNQHPKVMYNKPTTTNP